MYNSPDSIGRVDRKLGLEYAWRQHPALTPGAEASGITEAGSEQFTGSDTPMNTLDPAMAFFAVLTRKILGSDENYGVYHVTTPGQSFQRPRILVQSISNLCNANVVISLAEGERLPGHESLRVGIAVNGMPPSNLSWIFQRAMVVRQVYTTSGPTATAQITVGGTWAVGQVYSVSVNTPNPANPTSSTYLQVTLSYTSVTGDINNAGTATSIAAAWNANATLATIATASAAAGVVTLTAVNAGSLVQQTKLSVTATGIGTLTKIDFNGATNPDVAIAFQ